jgi:hypothetical protein
VPLPTTLEPGRYRVEMSFADRDGSALSENATEVVVR